MSRSVFEKRDLEYVRALCIASFWLSDASRIFSSDAIRRAADMRLHRSFHHITNRSLDSIMVNSRTEERERERQSSIVQGDRLKFLAGVGGRAEISTLSQVDRQVQTAPEIELVDRTRLWYLLFTCDQHLSILHNREPLLRGDKEITVNWEAYLDRPSRQDSDIRILSRFHCCSSWGKREIPLARSRRWAFLSH